MRFHYVTGGPFTKLLARYIDAEYLELAGFEFRVVDAGDLRSPFLRNRYGDLERGRNVTHIEDQNQLTSYARAVKVGDVVLFDSVTEESLANRNSPYNVFATTPAIIAVANTGLIRPPIPYAVGKSGWLRRPTRRIWDAASNPQRVFPYVRKRISNHAVLFLQRSLWINRSTLRPRPLDFLWLAHSKNNLTDRVVADSTFIRHIHTMDYDAINRETIKPAQDCDYLLFLDSMGPAHPDYLIRIPIGHYRLSSDEYFALVRRALESIASQTQYRLIIAAHPRNPEGSLDGVYGEFEVAYHRTPGLIARCRAVIDASCSTSLSMAVVAKRPISLLTSRTFGNFIRRAQRDEANRLALKRIDIDAAVDNWQIPEVNLLAYQQYIEMFVKRRGTLETPFWSQVASDLSSRLR